MLKQQPAPKVSKSVVVKGGRHWGVHRILSRVSSHVAVAVAIADSVAVVVASVAAARDMYLLCLLAQHAPPFPLQLVHMHEYLYIYMSCPFVVLFLKEADRLRTENVAAFFLALWRGYVTTEYIAERRVSFACHHRDVKYFVNGYMSSRPLVLFCIPAQHASIAYQRSIAILLICCSLPTIYRDTY